MDYDFFVTNKNNNSANPVEIEIIANNANPATKKIPQCKTDNLTTDKLFIKASKNGQYIKPGFIAVEAIQWTPDPRTSHTRGMVITTSYDRPSKTIELQVGIVDSATIGTIPKTINVSAGGN